MMCDKFDDCVAQGYSQEESLKKACELMQDCKSAVREIEVGSSLGALRKRMTDLLAFSAVFLMTLTCAYLVLSICVFKTFEKTWMLPVVGAFAYLIYIATSLHSYAKMFEFRGLQRIAFGGIFLSLLPMLYVLPGMVAGIFLGKNIWPTSWLIVILLGIIYLAADITFFVESKLGFRLELAGLGLGIATLLYLALSMTYGIWNVAWLVYVVYLVIAAFTIYFVEKRASRLK